MNKLTKIKIAGTCMVAALAPALMADTVVLTQSGYSYSDGGEFTATTTPTLKVGDYSHYTSTATSFQTFCVQVGTDFQPGATYTYSLSSLSLGGPGYPGGPVGVGTPYSYPLSEGAAWLYASFATGNLGGYDYNNAGGDRKADAGLLQAALWYFQGGQVGSGFPTGGPANPYTAQALGVLGTSAYTNASGATAFGVEVMNLTAYGSETAGNYQNQLVLVPDGGSTVILLGAALSGLAIYRRKF